MFERLRKYSEILLLSYLLDEKKIPYEMEPWLDGFHIALPSFGRKMKLSVIEHEFSYGNGINRLETMDAAGHVRTGMSAEDVLWLIKDMENKNDF